MPSKNACLVYRKSRPNWVISTASTALAGNSQNISKASALGKCRKNIKESTADEVTMHMREVFDTRESTSAPAIPPVLLSRSWCHSLLYLVALYSLCFFSTIARVR